MKKNNKPYARGIASSNCASILLETWSEFPQFYRVELTKHNRKIKNLTAREIYMLLVDFTSTGGPFATRQPKERKKGMHLVKVFL